MMVLTIVNLLFGCHHRRITRPMTPVRNGRSNPSLTYVACLDCGKQLKYDLATMSIGAVIPTSLCPVPSQQLDRPAAEVQKQLRSVTEI